jgi:hypothetical protein
MYATAQLSQHHGLTLCQQELAFLATTISDETSPLHLALKDTTTVVAE